MDSIVFLRIRRPSPYFLQQIEELSLATVFEAYNETKLMDPGIKSLASGYRICGPAITCRVEPGDNLALHKALLIAEKGDVLVVDGSGLLCVAVWGSVMSRPGIVGAVKKTGSQPPQRENQIPPTGSFGSDHDFGGTPT